MKTRREFLTTAAAVALAASTKKLRALDNASEAAGLTISATRTVTIPKNFTGLSYESQQLTDPNFFSPANHQLIAQFKALAPNGVLRIGGNTSDFSWWKPTPAAVPPPRTQAVVVSGEPAGDFSYPITPAAIDNLRKFLDAVNWTCIYGLNLGTGTPTRAAEEAACVSRSLGPRLEYFQIGNEVDLFSRHLRDPKTWSPDTYFAEWLAMARAITERVPSAPFGAPDVANHSDWLTAFAADIAATPNPPHIGAVTHHHYVGGPPSSPQMTIPHILAGASADPMIDQAAALAQAAAAQLKTAFRMTEGNTCYRGGKPGVSDVFAASLWSADYLLHLASLGYAGVNLHGGDAKAVANSLGGSLPGEALMKDPTEPHPKPFYTPIANINGTYTAEPVFYGMLFAQQFAGATLLQVTLDTSANAVAYAAIRPDGKTLIAILNKDLTTDLNLRITGASPKTILRLTAPAIDSHTVTFGRAAVTATGAWTPTPEPIASKAPIHIPKASAALLISH